MRFVNLASSASAWRGLEYYQRKKVKSYIKTGEEQYEGGVEGSNGRKYDVFIDVEHPKRSKCNCPLAKDRILVCKHKIALYFAVFPEKADEYERLVEESERV